MTTPERFTHVLREWAETFMRRSMHDFIHFTRNAGLSMTQLSTLMRLYYHGDCGVTGIGAHLGVTNAAASQMVERLVQQGLLERSEDPSDRRVKQIAVTPRGRALIEEGIEARRRWMEQLTHALTPEELDLIVQALMVLNRAARKLEPQSLDLEGSSPLS